MKKQFDLRLFVALVLVGALVVFATPSLAGHAVKMSFQASQQTQPFDASTSQTTYLYPITPQAYVSVTNPNNAFLNNSDNFAIIGGVLNSTYNANPGYISYGCPVGNNFSRDPRPPESWRMETELWDVYGLFSETEEARTGIMPSNWCHFNSNSSLDPSFLRYANFTGWFRTLNAYTAGTLAITSPINITSVQVNSSELNFNCAGRECNRSAKVVVFVNVRCIGTSAYRWRYLGQCSVGNNAQRRVCTKSLGRESCSSGLWQVADLIIAQPLVNRGNPDPAVHWIRLVQNNG
ncbi:MAG: hypothetical protein Q8R15_01560 [Candidatus Micrarchaeota archaeon]|nr:hypothetical protein [Candidatus Micrarchaeota archaeon]